jgi:Protein of unknown function (DUF3460)
MYESEITKFLNQLKKDRPQLVEEQRKGRALLWDKPQDLDTSERHQASRIPMKAYPYQTK